MWLITNKAYDKLRTIKGCEMLQDLGATKTDAIHINNFAKGLKIPQDRIFRTEDGTIDDLKNVYKKILKLTRGLSHKEQQPHTLIVYAGGHGASNREQQLYLLNSDDPGSAMLQLEYKLRYLVKDEDSLLKVPKQVC